MNSGAARISNHSASLVPPAEPGLRRLKIARLRHELQVAKMRLTTALGNNGINPLADAWAAGDKPEHRPTQRTAAKACTASFPKYRGEVDQDEERQQRHPSRFRSPRELAANMNGEHIVDANDMERRDEKRILGDLIALRDDINRIEEELEHELATERSAAAALARGVPLTPARGALPFAPPAGAEVVRAQIRDFIAASVAGWDKGVSILHFLGGHSADVNGSRAISQTKMTISQRAEVHGVLVDVVCTGRFYDFLEKRNGRWGVVLRQPIYEKDRMDPVSPSATLELDPALLARFPEGYRHLAYLQTQIGYAVKTDMPGLKGPEVQALYARGARWLAGGPHG